MNFNRTQNVQFSFQPFNYYKVTKSQQFFFFFSFFFCNTNFYSISFKEISSINPQCAYIQDLSFYITIGYNITLMLEGCCMQSLHIILPLYIPRESEYGNKPAQPINKSSWKQTSLTNQQKLFSLSLSLSKDSSCITL